MNNLYELQSWQGGTNDITIGKVYNLKGLNFLDDAGDTRDVALGNWIRYVKATEDHGVNKENKPTLDNQDITGRHVDTDVRSHHIGNSDYSNHVIQPWGIWEEYDLNGWDCDIVKRVLRTKEDTNMTPRQQRILDYKKIIHNCQERIRQLES